MKKIAILIITAIFFVLSIKVVYASEDKIAFFSAQLSQDKHYSYKQDIRVIKLRNYLSKHNSPLAKYAENIVKSADTYGLKKDYWPLVAAIAGVESSFGKRIPANSYNAWGWGIPTGKKSGVSFNSWEEGIDTVTKEIKKKYIDKGAQTLSQIGKIYAPPSNTWTVNVQFFIDEINSSTVEPDLTI